MKAPTLKLSAAMVDPAMLMPLRWEKPMRPARRSSKMRVRGELKEIYAPVDAMGKVRKPSLNHYPTGQA